MGILRVVLTAWLAVLVWSCSSDEPKDSSTQGASSSDGSGGSSSGELLGEACPDTEEGGCGDRLECILGVCRAPCDADSDCDDGLCVGGSLPFGCQVSTEWTCSEEAPCPEGLRCGLDSVCRTLCQEGVCPRADQTCVAGACVADGETSEGAVQMLSCQEGSRRCRTSTVPEACNIAAPGWAEEACPEETPYCADGACIAGIAAEPPGPLVELENGEGYAYGIDRTEVTRAQYSQFLIDMRSELGTQPERCAWNTSYDPADASEAPWPPTDLADHPVQYVDWCDAHAYCAWAGKRLCGLIGGGPIDEAQPSNYRNEQWLNACMSGGMNDYGYAYDYFEGYCNDESSGLMQTAPVASFAECQSTVEGFEGVFDLSGNVSEWIDSCRPSTNTALPRDICRASGGSYPEGRADTFCQAPLALSVDSTSDDVFKIGFRCCSDP